MGEMRLLSCWFKLNFCYQLLNLISTYLASLEDPTGEFNPEENKIQKLLLKVDTSVVCSGAYGTTEESLKGTAPWPTQTRKSTSPTRLCTPVSPGCLAARPTPETSKTDTAISLSVLFFNFSIFL